MDDNAFRTDNSNGMLQFQGHLKCKSWLHFPLRIAH
ncbi:hypothetical protein scyTo_0008359, partial [Scyliorhinus torazame]|nr:hypothetical protein [Scyliorhinus torazame]